MRRDLMMLMILAVLTMGCSNCSGVDVVTYPVIETEIATVDGEAVSWAVSEALTGDWATAAADDQVTVHEVVDIGFDAAKAGCIAGDVWDKLIGKITVEAAMSIARSTLTAGLLVGGVYDYEILGPDVPHAEIGLAVSGKFAVLVHDALADGVVTAGDLYDIAWGPAELAVREAGKWDVVVIKATSSGAPITVGIFMTQGYDTGKAWLMVLHVWDRPVFKVKGDVAKATYAIRHALGIVK